MEKLIKLGLDSQNNSLLQINQDNFLTHGLILGMTGSGKTGLAISILESLILNDLPLIIIDPKSDLTNLLLPFDSESAKRAGITEDKMRSWQDNLSKSSIDQECINLYKDKLSIDLYTPNDDNGKNISLWHFESKAELQASDTQISDTTSLQEYFERKASALLELLDQSKLSVSNPLLIFTANILRYIYDNESKFDFNILVNYLLNEPFQSIGAIPLDIFCPKKDRQDLALKLNSVLLSSQAKKYFEGNKFDIGELFNTEQKRATIFSLRALDEKERMIFVENILSELLHYIRTLDGTDSLRANFYMDEIYSYFPPLSESPAKKSMLTLIKQARSQGLGILLATQNPSDLDYKALSNLSNIFVGRLNTPQDREKVINLLQNNVNMSTSRSDLDNILSSLQSREFIYASIYEEGLHKFTSRQTISYLPGPLTAKRIAEINSPYIYDKRKAPRSVVSDKSLAVENTNQVQDINNSIPSNNLDDLNDNLINQEIQSSKLVLENSTVSPQSSNLDFDTINSLDNPNNISQNSDTKSKSNRTIFYEDLPYPVYYDNRQLNNNGMYSAELFLSLNLIFEDKNMDMPYSENLNISCKLVDTVELLDINNLKYNETEASDLENQAKLNLDFEQLPKQLKNKSTLSNLQKRLIDKIYREKSLKLYYQPYLKVYSKPNETLDEFTIRLTDLAQIRSHEEAQKFESQYSKKINSIQKSIDRVEQQIEKLGFRIDKEKMNTTLQSGNAIFSAIFGSGKSSIISKAKSASLSHARSKELKENLALLHRERDELYDNLQTTENTAKEEMETLERDLISKMSQVEQKEIRVLKKNIFVNSFAFYWRS